MSIASRFLTVPHHTVLTLHNSNNKLCLLLLDILFENFRRVNVSCIESEQKRWHIKQKIIITIIILLLNKLRCDVQFNIMHACCWWNGMAWKWCSSRLFYLPPTTTANIHPLSHHQHKQHLSYTSATILKINMESVFRLFESLFLHHPCNAHVNGNEVCDKLATP